MGQCSNKTVILYWLDEYLGNTDLEILLNHELAQSIHVLSNYYGFGFISYADAVQDAVYSNTMEDTFTPGEWYNKGNLEAGMMRELHPGQSMHMATAWMVAYNLFSTVSTHCNVKLFHTKIQNTINGDAESISSDVGQRNIRASTPSFPSLQTLGMPPPLTEELKLDEISEQWRRDADAVTECGSLRADTKRCPVYWLAGFDASPTHEYFKSIVQSPVEWEVNGQAANFKFGWVPLT